MFRWARNRLTTDLQDVQPESGVPNPEIPYRTFASATWWIRLLPFFISALMFMSGVFAVFAPLPLLVTAFATRRRWLWLAAAVNALVVLWLGGGATLGVYACSVLALALALPELLSKNRAVEKSVGYTLLVMLASALAVAFFYWLLQGTNPVSEIKGLASGLVDQVAASIPVDVRASWQSGADPEEWKRGLLVELPSGLAIFSLVLVWANLTVLLKLNPGMVRERIGITADFFKTWKAPDILIWPTIIGGFMMLLDLGRLSELALNVFKFLLAVYAIHGLSILSYFLDTWGVKGILRTIGYLVSVFLMLPLLLSLGFFDLWFDFRAKLRQS